MTIIAVPYHLDERVDLSATRLTPDHIVERTPAGSTKWERMSVLYEWIPARPRA